MNDDEGQGAMHQMFLERQQCLEEALDRAESGNGSESDWNTIRFECGTPRHKADNTHRSEK